jgi:hypothetical protein
MKSNSKRKAQIVVDVLMAALLLLQMSYSLTGELLHEITGIAFFVLFIVHHILVRNYTKALLKGKHTNEKMLKIIVDILLLAIMLLMMASALPISKYVFTFLGINALSSVGRMVHLLGAYWGFALMNVHIGFHLDIMLNKLMKTKKTVCILVLCAVFIAGLITFIHEGIYKYMLLINQFVFFDTKGGLALFLVKYILIGCMFAVIGYTALSLLKGKRKNETI